ncbi:MAG: glutathione synthase [Thiobacillaceae bacterium]|jgi:glutathione synthase|nr:glutathione synthase [Thiobacillaceae bacterium]
MDILVVADPLASFRIYKDSTYAMMREAGRRGHAMHACEPQDLAWRDGRVLGRVARVALTGRAPDWFAAEAPEWRALADFGAVLMRKDPPFDQEYLYATYLLELAETDGARVFNRPRSLRDYNEKLAIARHRQFTVPTLVSCREDEIRAFLAEQGDIVVKPLNAMGGASVFRLRPGDANIGVSIEVLTGHGTTTVMAQRYIPEIADGDKRILVIDGEPAPYCLARIPAPGETRGNLAAGGRGVARPLTARDREIAQALGPVLKADGLLVVGLDVIGDWLTEINVTSPTCFREITDQTGFDVAGMFIDALERAVRGEG